jgi:flagellar hook-basal body complex protein FliE
MAPIALPAVVTADLKPLDGARPLAPERDGGGSFADALGQALQSVERLQTDADRDAQAVALGGGNLHETALALEKADVAMKLAVKVRNKLVEAYQDVMRMSV